MARDPIRSKNFQKKVQVTELRACPLADTVAVDRTQDK